MRSIRLVAPAKINWTLEVLGKRADGYHEIRSVMQTVNLYDTITLLPSASISLTVRGGTRSFRRDAKETPETNLAHRAAVLLQRRARTRRGAEIHLHKNVPIAAGLGGGSSDAAAVLRGLRALWDVDLDDDGLRSLASDLGSDVPFFVAGGTALASGRGDVIQHLPDVRQPDIAVTTRRARDLQDKTARMYQAISPEHFTDGARTQALADRIRSRKSVRERDAYNAFETILPVCAPSVAAAMSRAGANGLGTPHLCGSGPALFFFAKTFRAAVDANDVYHKAYVPVRPLSSSEATYMTLDG